VLQSCSKDKYLQKHALEVTLQYGKRLLHTFNYDFVDKTTSDLLDLTLNLFTRKLQGEFTVIGVESGNPDIDYYLSCPNRPLVGIRKPLVLTPLLQ